MKIGRASLVALLVLVAGITHASAAQAPANNDIANARVITTTPSDTISSDTWYATVEPGEPQPCPGTSRTVWYRFTPSTDTPVFAHTQNSGVDTTLALYQGSSPSDLVHLACATGYGYNQSRMTFQAQAGTTYWLQVSSKGGWSWFVGLYLVTDRPANDDRASATEIATLPASRAMNTQGQTQEPNETGCYEYSPYRGRGVWFKHTATADGEIVADTVGSAYPSIITVRSSANAFIGCSAYRDHLPASYSLNAVRGETYFFHVHSSYSSGSLVFNVRMVKPRNDDFSSAWWLSSEGPARFSHGTSMATLESSEPQPCGGIGSTVWWVYAPEADGTLVLDTTGSTFRTALAVYSGNSMSEATSLGCDASDPAARIEVPVTAGSLYRIQLGGVDGATGRYLLRSAVVKRGTYATPLILDCARGLGGACFTIPWPRATVDLAIDDASFDPAGATYEFRGRLYYGGGSALISKGRFCGSIKGLAIPSNAVQLHVIAGTSDGTCGSVATAGSIEARFWG